MINNNRFSFYEIKHNLLLFLSIFFLTLFCYLSVIPTYFISDDYVLIRKIAQEGMFYAWGEDSGGFLRPTTILSYWIDYKIWGLNPIGYHLTNILFHAIAAFGLYIISCQLIPNRKLISLSASCLFIVLPCHSESVSWISGRTDVIAVAFGFISTAIFLSVFRKESIYFSIWGLLFFVIALLAKEVVIILPVIWFLFYIYSWYVEKKIPSKYSLITLFVAWILLIGYFGLRKVTLGHFVGGYGTSQHISFINIENLNNIFKYSARVFLPPGLPEFLYTIFLLIIVTFGLIFLFKNFRKIYLTDRWAIFLLLMLCYLVGLIPTVTMSVSLIDTQNERFLFLSSGFACMILAVIVGKFFERKPIQISIFIFLIISLGFSLQWVNNRWITASVLSKQIATELSKMNLENIVVINVPDNYQGAYVFRNGLQEAAMLITGKNAERKAGYLRAIVYHNLVSLSQKIHTDILGSTVLVTFPNGLYFYEVSQPTFKTGREGQSLSILVPNESLKRLKFLSFESATSIPMLQEINLK